MPRLPHAGLGGAARTSFKAVRGAQQYVTQQPFFFSLQILGHSVTYFVLQVLVLMKEAASASCRSLKQGKAVLKAQGTTCKHKNTTNCGLWNPHCLGPQNQNVESSYLCGLWGPYVLPDYSQELPTRLASTEFPRQNQSNLQGPSTQLQGIYPTPGLFLKAQQKIHFFL